MCANCTAGTYMVPNAAQSGVSLSPTSCPTCPLRQYQDGAGQSACMPCLQSCGVGQFISGICSASSTPQCNTCPTGTFQTATIHNFTSCDPCHTQYCDVGEHMVGSCTPATTPPRVACPTGTYEDIGGTNATSCAPCTGPCALQGCFWTVCATPRHRQPAQLSVRLARSRLGPTPSRRALPAQLAHSSRCLARRRARQCPVIQTHCMATADRT